MGAYLPKRILTNFDLETIVETNDEWIVSRTGMRERRVAAPDEATSDMGAKAAEEALQNAGIDPLKIDAVICATMSPDYITPATATLIQHRIGADNAFAFDLAAACSGYLYGLSMAKAYIEAGIYQNILLIASEKLTAFLDYQDRNTCVLFGDGAAASVISSEGKGLAIDSLKLGAQGELADLIIIPGGGSRYPATQETLAEKQHYVKMMGKEVFKHAVRRMNSAVDECLAHAHISKDKVDWLVPHQANLRIMDAVADKAGIPTEKVYKTVHKYGNTSASGVAIALKELLEEHALQADQHVLLVAFGAGLTWGAVLLTQLDA